MTSSVFASAPTSSIRYGFRGNSDRELALPKEIGITGRCPVNNPGMSKLLPRAEGALLAAAVGDALGWPQEDRGRRLRAPAGSEPKMEFSPWLRRDGGRFAAHEVPIGAGEYSDDTQLILALAHALRAKDEWWERWTSVELPFWLQYERGGGAATKRSARSWSKGMPPWQADDPTSYFAAGGNGVAMRVLPHCVSGAIDDEFRPIAASVVRDGIATHGHPEAHVGALAYAYALWRALRWQRTLEYGELIAETRASVASWSQLPDDLPSEWQYAAERHFRGEYSDLWKLTVGRMVELLARSRSSDRPGSTLDRPRNAGRTRRLRSTDQWCRHGDSGRCVVPCITLCFSPCSGDRSGRV